MNQCVAWVKLALLALKLRMPTKFIYDLPSVSPLFVRNGPLWRCYLSESYCCTTPACAVDALFQPLPCSGLLQLAVESDLYHLPPQVGIDI